MLWLSVDVHVPSSVATIDPGRLGGSRARRGGASLRPGSSFPRFFCSITDGGSAIGRLEVRARYQIITILGDLAAGSWQLAELGGVGRTACHCDIEDHTPHTTLHTPHATHFIAAIGASAIGDKNPARAALNDIQGRREKEGLNLSGNLFPLFVLGNLRRAPPSVPLLTARTTPVNLCSSPTFLHPGTHFRTTSDLIFPSRELHFTDGRTFQ